MSLIVVNQVKGRGRIQCPLPKESSLFYDSYKGWDIIAIYPSLPDTSNCDGTVRVNEIKSVNDLDVLRHMRRRVAIVEKNNIVYICVNPISVGKFIGRKGCLVKALQKAIGKYIKVLPLIQANTKHYDARNKVYILTTIEGKEMTIPEEEYWKYEMGKESIIFKVEKGSTTATWWLLPKELW